MKYETIDYEQVKDIMEGREPRPPEGWDDAGTTADDSGDRSQGSAGPIGGPVGEH